MSAFYLGTLTEAPSQRTKGDKRGHFDVLRPSAFSLRMWRGFDQCLQLLIKNAALPIVGERHRMG